MTYGVAPVPPRTPGFDPGTESTRSFREQLILTLVSPPMKERLEEELWASRPSELGHAGLCPRRLSIQPLERIHIAWLHPGASGHRGEGAHPLKGDPPVWDHRSPEQPLWNWPISLAFLGSRAKKT